MITKIKRTLFTFVLLPVFTVVHAQTVYYVDPVKGSDANAGKTITLPFRSIERAQQAVRQVNKTAKNNIYVFLRGGEYLLQKPIYFDENDGGCNGFDIVYGAYKHEKVIISGGFKVSGWKLYDKSKNIYSTILPTNVDSRQLFVNGVRATRARSIGTEIRWITADSIGHLTSNLSMLKWKNHSNIECVYREIWTSPRCGIATMQQLNDTTLRIIMKQPGWVNCRNKGITSTRTPWYFENAFELLDDDGEWYIDKSGAVAGKANMLFYKPRSWENMETANIILPNIEKQIVVAGRDVKSPVRNIRFDGLQFEYTTWLRPNTNNGHSDAQNNVLRENATKNGEFIADGAALTMHNVQNVVIKNCSFTKMGCAAINMYAGCKNNVIDRCYFYDISGTGIQMGDYKNWKDSLSENAYYPLNESFLLKGNQVLNNHIENCGVEYRSATGIAAAFPVNMLIKGNTIVNMPYSGMHIGWGWTTYPQTVMQNNIIVNNNIQNVMLELADGGSIYTLGGNEKNKWSEISNNYMNRVMWGQCVYMDNGSSFYNINNNVYKDGDDYNVKINSGSHDIYVKGIYSNKKKNLVGKTGCYNYGIDSTQFFSPENQKLVTRIKKNAGAENYSTSAWQTYTNLHIYEAEHAEVTGKVYATAGIGTKVFGYSGMGFLSGFDKKTIGSAVFVINVSETKEYDLSLRYSAANGWGNKISIFVNNKSISIADIRSTINANTWAECSNTVMLHKGINTISYKMTDVNDGYLFFDYLKLSN
jgi:hypothetical protein